MTARLSLLCAASLAVALAPSIAGCAAEQSDPTPPVPDLARFEAEALPLLARDCAFPACHGNYERFFQVFASGRVRLDPTLDPFDPTTQQELAYTYARARSMLLPAPDTERSLLLEKPLGLGGGGAAHQGTDDHGRDVYTGRDDPSYRALRAWALNEPWVAPP